MVLQRCFYECIEGRDDVISIKIEVLFLQSFFRNIFWKVCAKGKAISKYGELYVVEISDLWIIKKEMKRLILQFLENTMSFYYIVRNVLKGIKSKRNKFQ